MEGKRLIFRYAEKAQRIAWYCMVAALPITSMPLVSRLLGADSVASPAIFFLALFAVIWLAAGVFQGMRLTRHTRGLILFCLAALVATALAQFYNFPLYKGFGYLRPAISAIGTLAIGFLFFSVAGSFPEKSGLKRTTFQILNFSGLALLVWCAIQGISWYSRMGYPRWMFDFQALFSQRVLYRQRVTGFALEPSWLAHQLNLLYLPYWLASTLTKTSNHSFRVLGFSFENLLLAGGVIALGLTLSRVGFAAFFMMLAITALVIHSRLVNWVQNFLGETIANGRIIKRWVISAAILLLYLLVVIVSVWLYSRVDERMANLFAFSLGRDNPLLRYFNELKFGDRVIYWLTGWNIFNDFPVMGVGLGNAGFFFPEEIPDFGWSLVEVRSLIYRTDVLLNIKNLWVRLLAETGIVGFSMFIGWLVSLAPEFINKYKSEINMRKTLGLMGMLTLAALFFEGFSIDSFAMPYLWVSLGLAAASYEA